MSESLNILVADDDSQILEQLVDLLSNHPSVNSVEAVSGGNQVKAALSNGGQFDVVLLDIEMTDGSGIEASQWVFDSNYEVPVVLMSSFQLQRHVENALRLPIAGFIEKASPVSHMVRVLEASLHAPVDERGWPIPILGSWPMKVLRDNFRQIAHQRDRNQWFFDKLDGLSELDHRLAEQIISGVPYRRIAERASLRPQTVRLHASRILAEFGCESRGDLAALALQAGWQPPGL